MTSKMSTGKKWNVKKGGYRNKKKQSTKKRKPSTRKSSKQKRKPSTRKPSKRKSSKRKPSKRSSVRKNKKSLKKMKGGNDVICADVNKKYIETNIQTFPKILKQEQNSPFTRCAPISYIPKQIITDWKYVSNYYKLQVDGTYLQYKKNGAYNPPDQVVYNSTGNIFRIKTFNEDIHDRKFDKYTLQQSYL